MAFEKFNTKLASEAVAVLLNQAVPTLPVITNEDIGRICRDSLKYDTEIGDRHIVASSDHLNPIVSWNLERVPQQLPAGQSIIGYQVDIQPDLHFAVLAIVIGDLQGSPGYLFGIRFWMTSGGLFVQGYEGFRTSPPELPTSEDISDKHLMAKGNSVEEARARIKEQIPYGMSVNSEEVLCDGEPQVLHGEGDSIAIASQNALLGKSTDAEVIEQRTLSEPQLARTPIEAFDEADAMRQAKKDLKAGERVTDIHIRVKGRTGFLGIGRKPHTYNVETLAPARVEVKVKPQALVKATVGLPRIQKAVAIVPKFAAGLDALVSQKISSAENQYTKLEMIETFLFALVQQDVGWISYEIYGIKRQHRPVSHVRWTSSSVEVQVKYHSDYADGSQGDWAFNIVRLSEDAFTFIGTYGTRSMEDTCMGLAGCGGTLGGSRPLEYFLQKCGIRDVLEEALRKGIVDNCV